MATIHKPFKYVPALQTDISVTIRREKARLKALEDAERLASAERAAKVTLLPTPRSQNAAEARVLHDAVASAGARPGGDAAGGSRGGDPRRPARLP
jgi:hypothetical protein